MSADSSHCRVPNCKFKKYIVAKFQDYFTCKTCGHGIDLHSNSANSIDNSTLATLPPAQAYKCYFATAVSNSENTIQGPPTPNHNNF